MQNQGVAKDAFPVTYSAAWAYCERMDKDGEIKDGSLVRIGTVVKQAHLRSLERGEETGYILSQAGADLAMSLLP